MAAEASAFLLKEKFQSLRDGVGIVFPGLKGKVTDVIVKLENLSQRCDDLAPQVLTSMHGLEDAIDAYLIRRTRPRWKLKHGDPSITSNASSSSFFTNFLVLPPLWSQMHLRQAINKFLKEVRNVKTQIDIVGNPPPSYWFRDRARSTSDGVFQFQDMGGKEDVGMGRKEDVDKLVSHLIKPEDRALNVFPLVGSRVQGKTEVVRCAYNSSQVKRRFQFRAWVYLHSQYYDFRHILVDLIHQGTTSRSTPLDRMEEEALQDMLFKMLMGKRYLIVFINVCTREAWTELVVPLPDSRNGSRVVVTTQNSDLSNFIDPFKPPMMLSQLSREASWLLLLKHVNPSIHNDETQRYDRLKEILRQKCKGIWIAIRLLSGVLYNKQLNEWEGVMKDIPDMQDETQLVKKMLDLSFRALHPILKGCLMYLILFPEELEIPVRRLLHLWLAEGFLNAQESLPEDGAEMCLEELINRKLIDVTNWKLDGRPKTCRMPGLIREILQDTLVQPSLFYVYHESGSQNGGVIEPQKSRRFAEHSSHGRSSNDHVLDQTNKHLHSYLSFNTHIRGTANTGIGNFLKVLIRKTGFALLRVLDLEGVYKPQLPDTIGTLLLLKFVGLRLTVLDSIPESICNLPLLEILDLKHTNVSIIPSSIWKSKSLRHLYLNEFRLDGSIGKTSAGSLANFQTIRGLYIVDERVVSSVLERFDNLRNVGITCRNDSIRKVTEWISQLAHLQTLKLRSLDRLGKPANLPTGQLKLKEKKISNLYLLGKLERPIDLGESLPMCLRKLTLSSFEINDESAMSVLGDLPELVILRLLANSYKCSRMSFSTGRFPKLRGLKLWMLPELEVWKVEKGSMPCLEELEFRKCNKVKTIDGLEHLTRLDELVLTNMPTNLTENIKENCRGSNVYIQENTWKFSYYQDETTDHNSGSTTPH